MSWAGLTGKAVPGYFDGNQPPNGTLAGSGVGTDRFTHIDYIKNEHGKEGNYFMHVKSPINAMNYIEASRLTLNNEIINLLNKITTAGEAGEARTAFKNL
jgi:hypothetical protein